MPRRKAAGLLQRAVTGRDPVWKARHELRAVTVGEVAVVWEHVVGPAPAGARSHTAGQQVRETCQHRRKRDSWYLTVLIGLADGFSISPQSGLLL